MVTAGSFDSIAVIARLFASGLGVRHIVCIADGTRQKLSLFLAICLASIVPVAASQTDRQKLSRAQEVWEGAIRAKGDAKAGSRAQHFHFIKILNMDSNEELFSKPPSLAAGPDAWKPN